MSDPTNADLIARYKIARKHGATGQLHDDLATALEQAGKELAEARVLLSTRVEAERLGEAQQLASSRSTEIARLTATIEAVKAAWFGPCKFTSDDSQKMTDILLGSTPTTDAVKLDPEPWAFPVQPMNPENYR